MNSVPNIPFAILTSNDKEYRYVDLKTASKNNGQSLSRMPYALRILLEGCLRNREKKGFQSDAAQALLAWSPASKKARSAVPFLPARVLMQDFTGLPVLNDLTALRSAVRADGKDPSVVNPTIASNLVIDHSVQVQAFARPDARSINEALEFKQNFERYRFLKWSQDAYDNLQVLPPGLGICHQVNLEHLGQVAWVVKRDDGANFIYPDSVLGTDSHTPMINGLGVLGWGVGGIEALAALLGYPTEFPIPNVIAVRLLGKLPATATATDLTLALTSMLRARGVVGSFVEIIGNSAAQLPVETRAMIANMTPESGATATYFPVDEQTIDYLMRTGRDPAQAALVRDYFKAAGLFIDGSDAPQYSGVIEFDLGSVQPNVAGPKRPQDVIPFNRVQVSFKTSLSAEKGLHGFGLDNNEVEKEVDVHIGGETHTLSNGAVLIAAITSCTNTSDPMVMFAAALLAKNAREAGLKPKAWVKTSFAPGSRVVSEYLAQAGLMDSMEAMGFGVVGYGCTTCIGNSGPINPALAQAVQDNHLIAAGVLSGNRNFEGRIHPVTQANFLMSPPLVMAYALAGTVNFDFEDTPLGIGKDGQEVYLQDIYPDQILVQSAVKKYIGQQMYANNYADIYNGNEKWNNMETGSGAIYDWEDSSTLIKEPAFLFDGFGKNGKPVDIQGAYALAILGDSITTDHISPAGRISSGNAAAIYLEEQGIAAADFISFGARRGNDEVMARGTFSNPRLRNKLAGGKDGGFTRHIPSGNSMSIYDAAMRYKAENTPLVIIAGSAYGTGSSRDWAAKGTYLLGVHAVIAKSYERIHRTNLVCMGILPMQFPEGMDADSLGLVGSEQFTIQNITSINSTQPELEVQINRAEGRVDTFSAIARIDTPLELAYFKAGGLMRKLRQDF